MIKYYFLSAKYVLLKGKGEGESNQKLKIYLKGKAQTLEVYI